MRVASLGQETPETTTDTGAQRDELWFALSYNAKETPKNATTEELCQNMKGRGFFFFFC